MINRAGETLAESIIALTVLAIGITMAGMVIGTSLTNVQGTGERVIAVNIGREGLEAMRNIRDTNWLKFSGNRRECWNHMPLSLDNPVHSVCDSVTNKIGTDTDQYLIYLDEKNQWRLQAYDSSAEDRFLAIVDVDPLTDSDGDRNPAKDEDLYNHVLTDALGRDNARTTKFSRFLTVSYLDNAGDAGNTDDNRMRVDATVEWTDKSDKTLTLSTLMTDYLGRDNLDD